MTTFNLLTLIYLLNGSFSMVDGLKNLILPSGCVYCIEPSCNNVKLLFPSSEETVSFTSNKSPFCLYSLIKLASLLIVSLETLS